ncbi:ribokinase [Engelhardtia mirabilis]|uniref:Ribokinase n=1 Tax=Engelhardtia mirabilis TaxID=2528011 RepID=A0A518BJT5_9BACT|nr:Ribokinase [Planctomycetes bacterium Pla133]QDV01564.1 Ribokinase [Planctomycetes bacterium Pla86]
MSEAICVLGALHMDLTIEVEHLPSVGETEIGKGLEVHPGGKGATQAVAAARLGASVSLVGAVGDDGWGADLRSALLAEGVNLSGVVSSSAAVTGVALRARHASGESATVIGPGANRMVDVAVIEAAREAFAHAKVFLCQLEIGEDALSAAVELARASGALVVLNAAPARELSREFLAKIDVIVANRREGARLARVEKDECSDSGLMRRIAALGPSKVVLTRGKRGAMFFDGERTFEQAGFPAERLDSTAASDAFCGALAVALAEEQRWDQALRFACAASALSAEVQGSFPSLPTRDVLEPRL